MIKPIVSTDTVAMENEFIDWLVEIGYPFDFNFSKPAPVNEWALALAWWETQGDHSGESVSDYHSMLLELMYGGHGC